MYALIGGVPPLMPALEPTQLKKRPPTDEKVVRFFGFSVVQLLTFVVLKIVELM